MTIDYNSGKWIGWNGGECPVHLKSEVEVVIRDPEGLARLSAGIADSFRWEHPEGYLNIITFRVVKEHREPREFWVWEDTSGTVHIGKKPIPGSFKVREVLE